MKRGLLALTLILLSLGCGSKTPFSRGASSLGDNPLVPQKPTDPVAQTLDPQMFQQVILPNLNKDCASCHDNKADTFLKAQALVVTGKATESALYLKATGLQSHPKIWSEDSIEAQVLKSWIQGGQLAAETEPVPEPVDSEAFFVQSVAPLLKQDCASCHRGRDGYTQAKQFIQPGSAEQSQLYLRASGTRHRKIWAPESSQLATLKQWIDSEQ